MAKREQEHGCFTFEIIFDSILPVFTFQNTCEYNFVPNRDPILTCALIWYSAFAISMKMLAFGRPREV